MAYIINQWGGGFQQGGYLYKPTYDIQWMHKHSWMSDRSQKYATASNTTEIMKIGKKSWQIAVIYQIRQSIFTTKAFYCMVCSVWSYIASYVRWV